MLKSVVIIGAFLAVVIRFSFRPFRLLGKLFFLVFFVNLYKVYLFFKRRLVAIWRPAKNRLLFPLSTRYVVHAVIIILTVLVTTNSLKARETRGEDAYRPIVLSTIIQSDENDEIVETADSVLYRHDYYDGIGGVSPFDFVEEANVATLAATQESSSLIKPSVMETTVGERPRENVVYHTVAGGETVGTIAEQYHVSSNTILWENKLGERDYIQPGQVLTILPTTGVSHQVKMGDTIASIAKKYDAEEATIIESNKLADAGAISAGEILIIPNGRVVPPPVVPTTRYAGSAGYDTNPPPGISAPRGSGLLWPTSSHRINQYYTYRHRGIDIDGDYSSPIYASEGGRVEFVGWGGGYGLHVTINHGNGMKTLYAHASKTFVKVGQSVDKGQTIAMQGSTGWSTGVHLHFEVFINGSKVNPFSYL